jgi:hypothetical protein
LGCAVVSTELVPGCSGKGKTIANLLAVVFFIDMALRRLQEGISNIL